MLHQTVLNGFSSPFMFELQESEMVPNNAAVTIMFHLANVVITIKPFHILSKLPTQTLVYSKKYICFDQIYSIAALCVDDYYPPG